MKKRLFFVLAVVLVLAFSASSFADTLKVAIVTSPNDVHDGGFNEDNYTGLVEFTQSNSDSSLTTIQDKTGDPASCVKTVEDIAADYDAVVCVGFQFSGIAELAEDNPT